MSLIIGLDPGTGKSSPTGIAIFSAERREILFTADLRPTTQHKARPASILRDIAKKVESAFDRLEPGQVKIACIETFVMQGRGGQTLHELRGALMAAIPYDVKVQVVYNTTVKRLVSGRGDADKQAVAEGVATFFQSDAKSYNHVLALMGDSEWDQLDALAIGIAGWMQEINEQTT